MLLEREDVLQCLQDALDRVHRGAGEVVSVTGEAGVGKTVLLRAFAASASARASILWGSCDGLRTPRPLGPIADFAPEAGPELRAALESGAGRDAVFAAAMQLVRTADPALVMVIEDVHWADEATLDLLTFLGRRIGSTPTLLVLSYRDDEVGSVHPLRAVLGDLASVIRDRIPIRPLSLRSVSAMAGGRHVDAGELHRLTGGNAFFVTESLAAAPAALPESVRDAVLARAARLTDPARRALDACAVVPGRAELWLLDALAGEDLPGVDECIQRGILQPAGDAVTFRHELGRLAILAAVPPTRRRDLHRRALVALADPPAGPPDPTRLAHHADEAGDRQAILRYAPQAADRASRSGAHRAAASHLAAALRYAADLPVEARIDLYARRGHECSLTGDLPEGVEAYEAAVQCCRALGDRAREGELLTRLSNPLSLVGRQPEAVEAIRRGIELLEPLGPAPRLALAYARLCAEHMRAREFAPAAQWGDRAIALSEQLGCDDHLCHALISSGIALVIDGDDSGLARIDRAIDLARREGWHDTVALGLYQLGTGTGEVRRFDLAIPTLLECIDWSREHELAASELYATAWLARCRLDTANWAEAEALASALLANTRCVGISRFVALATLGRLRARQGGADVWPLLDEAQELARATGHLQRLWPVAATRAEASWLEGRLADEVPALVEAHAMADRLGYPWAIEELAFWLWRAGRPVTVRPVPVTPFPAHAAGRFEQSSRAWQDFGCPYESAAALADADDVPALRSAFETLDRLGAGPLLAVVGDRLRAAGERLPRRPRATTRSNPLGLTDREIEVIRLLADGLTDGEIAGRLFISAKTVGHHVSSVLGKLGVGSRRDVARAAGSLGLGGSGGSTSE